MKRDINYCENCGDNPATQQRPDDPNAYCDTCVGRMSMEDSGVVFYAMQTVLHALDMIRHYVPPADVRRLVDDALTAALEGECAAETFDVPSYEIDSGFRPVKQATAA